MTLKAKTAIKPFECKVHIKPEEAKEGTLFHSLGAKQMIRDLQEGRSFMHGLNAELLPNKTAQHVKEETIRLSTRYGVLCKLTAFVGIEERDEATEGTMQVRKIGVDTAPSPGMSYKFPSLPSSPCHANNRIDQCLSHRHLCNNSISRCLRQLQKSTWLDLAPDPYPALLFLLRRPLRSPGDRRLVALLPRHKRKEA